MSASLQGSKASHGIRPNISGRSRAGDQLAASLLGFTIVQASG